MVIQRLQTLFLILAVVFMSLFTFATPFAVTGETLHFVHQFEVWMIVNIVIAALLFIAIFMYKNLKRQISVTLVSILLICASMVTGAFIVYGSLPGAEVMWFGGVLLILAALISAFAAYRRMKHDMRILASYDRLR